MNPLEKCICLVAKHDFLNAKSKIKFQLMSKNAEEVGLDSMNFVIVRSYEVLKCSTSLTVNTAVAYIYWSDTVDISSGIRL